MNIAVRYQSRGGNTRAVAEAIAKAAGVTAQSIDTPLTETADVLFVGGGVYAGEMHKRLRAYLAGLDPALVKSVAAFSTGGEASVTDKIAAAISERGIPVRSEALSFQLGKKNFYLFGKKKTLTLTQEQMDAVAAFVRSVTANQPNE